MLSPQRVTGEGIEVTSLAWALDGMEQGGRWRTFASLLDGSICEVDWRASALAAATDSAGGVIWALATQPVEAIKLGEERIQLVTCGEYHYGKQRQIRHITACR